MCGVPVRLLPLKGSEVFPLWIVPGGICSVGVRRLERPSPFSLVFAREHICGCKVVAGCPVAVSNWWVAVHRYPPLVMFQRGFMRLWNLLDHFVENWFITQSFNYEHGGHLLVQRLTTLASVHFEFCCICALLLLPLLVTFTVIYASVFLYFLVCWLLNTQIKVSISK